jgi:two-component system chemotaxis response regulator CheB
MPTKSGKINVLVVDCSRLVRRSIAGILDSLEGVVVKECLEDGPAALRGTMEQHPDLLIMSLTLARLSSRAVLTQIMTQRPTPVIIIDDKIDPAGSEAHELIAQGAFQVIRRPALYCASAEFDAFRATLVQWVLRAGKAKVVRLLNNQAPPALSVAPPDPAGMPHDEGTWPQEVLTSLQTTAANGAQAGLERIVTIGASTGGPTALATLLRQLPSSFPWPILIAQHMPRGFTQELARHLNSICEIGVRQCEDEDCLQPGVALIAPGRSNIRLRSTTKVQLEWSTSTAGYSPSVNELFNAVAAKFGPNALAVVLTGMGDDGAEGVRRIKELGGRVISQSEFSAMIFGMPQAAIKTGCTDVVADLDGIAAQMCSFGMNPTRESVSDAIA